MPSLYDLTDAYKEPDNALPVEKSIGTNTTSNSDDDYFSRPAVPMPELPNGNPVQRLIKRLAETTVSEGHPLGNQLFGTGGEERFKFWPERMVKEGLTATGDIIKANPYPEGSEEYHWYEDQRQKAMVPAAMSVSALAGTGGLAGTGEGVALGSGPILRPALKYKDRIYKGKEGQQHLDVLPAHLAEDFQSKALRGDDINDYNFGFMNHKGQFLNREDALDYAIKEGLVDPNSGKYGALTSTLLADSSKPGVAIEAMAKTKEPFFSAVEHQVNQINQSKMTGDQWLGTLSNKPGVKPEELDWTGLKDFLKEKGKEPVTKQEVQAYVEANKVELKEVNKGGEAGTKEAAFELAKEHGWKSWDDIDLQTQAKYMQRASKEAGENPTKYHSYQLPGGENYREMLLTLPTKNMKRWAELDNKAVRTPAEREEYLKLSKEANDYKSSHWDEPNILAHVRMNDRYFDNPNVAKPKPLTDADFARMKELDTLLKNADYTKPETINLMKEQNEIGARIENSKDKTFAPNKGKLKSLHLEEIQSDWHQHGRDRGYKTGTKEAFEKYRNEMGDKYGIIGPAIRDRMGKDELTKFDELYKSYQAETHGSGNGLTPVPDAPFKKSWHELALKRMIREAAEKGYDRLSWTPGEAQAARYDLSKSIEKVVYNPKNNTLDAIGKDGRNVLHEPNVAPEKISDFIGKEAADKLLKTSPKLDLYDTPTHNLLNADLKIGGDGMKGFYDQIIPKALEKIGKEHGVKVKSHMLETNPKGWRITPPSETVSGKWMVKSNDYNSKGFHFETEAEAQAKLAQNIAGERSAQPIHYIDIPQSLKDQAMHKGFPLFSGGYQFIPVAGNPFEDKK